MAELPNKVLAALAGGGKLKVSEIADKAGLLQRQVSNALTRMKLTGQVTKGKGLLWSLSGKAGKSGKPVKLPKSAKPAARHRPSTAPTRRTPQPGPCAAITADHRIVLLGATGGGAVLSVEESLEVANLVFAHFNEA